MKLMKLQIQMLILAAFAATLIVGCTGQAVNNTRAAASSPSPAPTFSPAAPPQDNVERITLADAKKESDHQER